jgi:polyisoprenoid-binding protein YceI
MTRTTLMTLGLTTALAVPAAAGDTYTMDKAHTEAAFQVRHLLTKVRGVFRDLDGTIQFDEADPSRSTVAFHVKTASVDTGVAQRDNHLRSADFFWVEKYPEITFTSRRVIPKGGNLFDVIGDLTIRGVTHEVTLPVTYLGEEKDPYGHVKAGFETGVTLNRKDYGLVWNQMLEAGGVLVGEQVDISINIEAARSDAPTATN